MQVATVGHVPTSPFSVLCASASTVPGAHHAAQEEEPGSRTGGGEGASELVLALSLSLSFTSQKRNLCSARWRAQGWRGECRSKASDQVGKPWLPSQAWGLESHTQWHAPGRPPPLRPPPLLGSSFTRHRTLKCQNSGRLAASVFCAFGYAAQSFACTSGACPAQSSNRTQHQAQRRVQCRSRTSNSARGCRRWHLQQSRMAPCKSSWTSPLRRCSVHTRTVHAM